MIQEGQIILFKFPQTDQAPGKLRPALVLRKLPDLYEDWLVCMVSSHLSRQITGFDGIIHENDPDFEQSGLKMSSVIRIGRLAVVNKDILLGSIGNIGTDRLNLIKNRIPCGLRAHNKVFQMAEGL